MTGENRIIRGDKRRSEPCTRFNSMIDSIRRLKTSRVGLWLRDGRRLRRRRVAERLHESQNLEYLFTPDRLAHIDRAAAQIDTCQGIPAEKSATTSSRSTNRERCGQIGITGQLRPPCDPDLDAVWDWNAKTYGPPHAARYVDFLRRHIDALGENHPRRKGRRIPPGPALYLDQPAKRGHGHIAVYRVDVDNVSVLHIFHTAQEWQTKLAGKTSAK